MRLKKIVGTALLGCATLGVSVNIGFAQQPAQAHQHAAAAKAAPAPAMGATCQAMMAGRDKMMAEMKAADLRLDGLVTTMNATTGQPKVDATSSVVTEMVAQRKTMHDGMMAMQQDMMAHMMEHMQGGKPPMAMCPMMKMKASKPVEN